MPKVAIFDLIGTLFSLERMGRALEEGGMQGDCWFQETIQNAMAATLAERYLPFRDVMELSLTNMAEIRGLEALSVPDILETLKDLEPETGAYDCLKELQTLGVRLAVLTNGSRSLVTSLLTRHGLDRFFQMVISTDEVERCKPHPSTYLLATERMDSEPGEAWMVAAHGWDIYGAAAAGMHTAWVMNRDRRWPFPGLPPGATVSAMGEIPEIIRTWGK